MSARQKENSAHTNEVEPRAERAVARGLIRRDWGSTFASDRRVKVSRAIEVIAGRGSWYRLSQRCFELLLKLISSLFCHPSLGASS